jgi:PPOX class probable F420-dependent enzyme
VDPAGRGAAQPGLTARSRTIAGMNAASSPTIALTPHIREFVAAPHYASVATTEADGSPRQAVIWYLLEGDELVVNSRVGRHWPTNLLRDERVYLAVFDETDPMRWVGLLGTAEPVRDQPRAQADIAAMARRYEDAATAAGSIRAFEQQERISFRIRVRAVHDHLD